MIQNLRPRHTLPTLDPRRLARRAQDEPDDGAAWLIAQAVSRLGAGGEQEPPPPSSPAAADSAANDPRPVAQPLPRLRPELMGTAAPDPLSPLPQPQSAGPVVTPAERRELGPLPVMRNAKGEALTRPEYDDTGDERADLANYERSLEMLRNPADRNGRGRSALARAALGALQGLGQTGSLAGAVGGAISGGVYGAARPNWDERVDRDAEQARVGARQRDVDEQARRDLNLRLRTAQAVDEESQPAFRREQLAATQLGKTQTRLLSQIRTQGRYKLGENPTFDRQIDEAGLAVSDFEKGSKLQWHEAGGQVYIMDPATGRVEYAVAGDRNVEDASKKPNAEGLTPVQAKAAEDRDADRVSREREGELNRQSRERVSARVVSSREKIATVNQAISRERLRLTQERDAGARQRAEARLRAQYPGYGRRLTREDILTKYNQVKNTYPNMTLERVVDAAIEQGYEVER